MYFTFWTLRVKMCRVSIFSLAFSWFSIFSQFSPRNASYLFSYITEKFWSSTFFLLFIYYLAHFKLYIDLFFKINSFYTTDSNSSIFSMHLFQFHNNNNPSYYNSNNAFNAYLTRFVFIIAKIKFALKNKQNIILKINA